MLICHCKTVNDAAIRNLLQAGRLTVADIAAQCGAGTDCGGCIDAIEDLLAASYGSPVTIGTACV
ncbi:MAG: (2Fe-2S)-binding protein [Actinomycetota bacterium]